MTNEEAREILEERWKYSKTYKYTDAEIREAFDMAIKALEFDLDKHDEEVIKNTVESIWGEPCEDCISRERVLYEAKYYADRPTDTFIKDVLKQLPSVTPQPQTDILDNDACKHLSSDDIKKIIEEGNDEEEDEIL